MPQLSHHRLDKEQKEKIMKAFHFVLAKIAKADEMHSFLLSLLTPTEREMLAKRLTTFLLIKEGYSDTEIVIALHSTPLTVSRLRYFSESSGYDGYAIAWKIMQDEKFNKEIKELLLDLAGYAARAAGGRIKPSIF